MSIKKGLQKKTLSGLIWSFIDLIANQGIQFIIMVILARLLLPDHFGLIGMIMIFVALSQTLVDSGFSQALIREEKLNKIDYSTIFIFNLFFSIIIYLLIYSIAPLVSQFYSEPRIVNLLRVIGLVVFFQAISIVPRTILIRKVDFKTQAKVSVVSSVLSGLFAIFLAMNGAGVWALVYRILIQKAIESIILIFINKFKIKMKFSFTSFRKFYSFGWKLLVSSIIDTIYMNIYYVIIGKMYTTRDLGLYTNARQLRDSINNGITRSIQRVTYPVLSNIQSEENKLKSSFKKLIQITAYIFFPLMLGLSAVSDSLIVFILGSKWEEAIIYFKLLCVATILYPMHAINLNILKVKGRSDLFLRLEIYKKIMTTCALGVTVYLNLGVTSFILTAIITSHISLFINTYYSGKEIGYGTKDQIKDLIPTYLISFIMAITVYYIGVSLNQHLILIVIIQVLSGILIYIVLSFVFKIQQIFEVWRIIKSLTMKFK